MRGGHELIVWTFPEEAAPAFAQAPMPAAGFAMLDRRCLRLAGSEVNEALAEPLAQRLAVAAPGDTLGASDAAGRVLRLRCLDAPAALWALEPIEAGRRRTLEAIGTATLLILGPAIVHELQNPLNSACLRLELLRRAAPTGDWTQQVDAVREPLHRLADLQATLSQRWLQGARDADDVPQELQGLVGSLIGPLRSHYARRGSHVELESAQIQAELSGAVASALRIALPALLLMLAPPAETAERAAVQLRVGVEEDEAILELPLPADGGALGEMLEWSCAELLAALGFALHASGIAISAGNGLRLRLPLTSDRRAQDEQLTAMCRASGGGSSA